MQGHDSPPSRSTEGFSLLGGVREHVKVALGQLDPFVGDKGRNLKKLANAIGAAKADLFLAGELFLSGYMARDGFPQLAEPIDGPSVRVVQALAMEHGTHLVFGMQP